MQQQGQTMTRANKSSDHHKLYISETLVNNLRLKLNKTNLKGQSNQVLWATIFHLQMRKTDVKTMKTIGCSKRLQEQKKAKIKNLSQVLIKLKIAE